MKRQSQIPNHNLWMAFAGVLLVHVFGPLPRGVVIATATAAPWATLLAGLLALLMVWPVLAVLAVRPGQGLVHLCLSAGGRWLAVIFAVTITLLAVIRIGLTLRSFSEMAVTAIFPHTPQTFIMVSLLVTSYLGAIMEPPDLFWLSALAFTPLALGVVLILVGNFGWMSMRELLPLTGPGLIPVGTRLLPLTSYFGDIVALTVLGQHARTPRKLPLLGLQIIGVFGLFLALTTLFYLTVFPYPQGLSIPFPLFEMTRLMKGGRFLERLDTLWLVLWASVGALYMSGVLQAAAIVFRDAFRLPGHREAVLPITVAALGASLYPSNQGAVLAIDTYWLNRWGWLLTLVAPLVIAVLTVFRGRRS